MDKEVNSIKVVMPEGWDIKIVKVEEGKYRLEYAEYVKKTDENEQAVKTAIDLMEGFIKSRGIDTEVYEKDGMVYVAFKLVGSIHEIADHVVGEFLCFSSLANMTLQQMFIRGIVGSLDIYNKEEALKQEEK